MKRALMLFLTGVLLSTLAVAQVVELNQRGRATQELKAEGFYIAHPKLPIYSKIWVENTRTGKQIEATVSDRIPASSDRIADLSYSVWRELGLTANSEIRIFTPPVVRQRPQSPPVQIAEPEPIKEPLYITDPEVMAMLANLENKVDRYPSGEELIDRFIEITKSEMPQPEKYDDSEIKAMLANLENKVDRYPSDEELLSKLIAMIKSEIPQPEKYDDSEIKTMLEGMEAREKEREAAVLEAVALEAAARESADTARDVAIREAAAREAIIREAAAREAALAQEAAAREAALAQEAAKTTPPAPVLNPRIVPGFPDPNSGKNYRMQLGAFSSSEAANSVARLVGSVGFDVILEEENRVYRVLAINIPANMVYPATQRLALLGIQQIWIREQ